VTITLRLSPKLERRLTEEAARCGQDVESVAVAALEDWSVGSRLDDDRVQRTPEQIIADSFARFPPGTPEEIEELARRQGVPVFSGESLRDLGPPHPMRILTSTSSSQRESGGRGKDAELYDRWGSVTAAAQGRQGSNAPLDAWIAATALRLRIPLVTHNPDAFAGIPGLFLITERPGGSRGSRSGHQTVWPGIAIVR
jgi:hypothetical protein